MMNMSVEFWWNDTDSKTKIFREKNPPEATLSTTNHPAWDQTWAGYYRPEPWHGTL
jgi:hypothetical protein